MPSPAEWFVKAIGILDPYLRVRWSDHSSQYVVDRKAIIPPDEIHFLRKREAGLWWQSQEQNLPIDTPTKELHRKRMAWISCREELTSAEDGRRVIFTTKDITPKTYEWLCASDIRNYGGYARFADDLEAEEARAQVERDRINENKMNAMSGEVYDIMNFLERKKGVLLDQNCMDLSLMLHGKKTTAESEPLIKFTDL